MFFGTISLLLVIFTVNSVRCSNPTVEISDGSLEGVWNENDSGVTYASFLGIPYAKPPIGDLRFQDPQAVDSWSGVWNATTYGSSCLQYDALNQAIAGNESCLFLNVYTPTTTSTASLPVAVFIHGGGFLYGSAAQYDFKRLMTGEIIVVAMNYRLGPLGFLSTGDSVIPGNAGLKDQALALQWVQKNIKAFGGDPDNVTLFGQSAGAVSAAYHLLSDLSNGTFHRAAIFSGSPFVPWGLQKKPAEKAEALAAIVGCSTASTEDMASCFKNTSGEVLANAQLQMIGWTVALISPFAPCVESSTYSNPFISDTPENIFMSHATKVPLIVTTTSNEGLYPTAAYIGYNLLSELSANWTNLAPITLLFNDSISADLLSGVVNSITEEYLGGEEISETTFSLLTQIYTDRLFAVGISKMAQLYAQYSEEPVYFSEYKFVGNYSLTNLLAQDTKQYGACHGDDVLHMIEAFDLDSNSTDDVTMKKIIVNTFLTFVTSGTPGLSDSITWDPMTPGSSDIDFFDITSPYEYGMNSTSDFGRTSFWEGLGSEDCLYLNIFSSNPVSNALLPVIVFIHGGGLISSSASQYDPVRIMEYDVVVVTINYRLGPLGFLSTGDDVVPGNAGLKDQCMALRWIHNEIRNFGGNPDSITLTGSSSGSGCVYLHYLSECSKGTFHRGVQYSGSAFAPWALDEKPVQKTQYLAGRVGCPNDTSIEMITCLKNASAEDMVTSQLGLLISQVRLSSVFGPVIESSDVENPFLIQNPYEAAKSGLMQKLPLMMTTTFADGLLPSSGYLARQEYMDDLESRWDQLASEVFVYKDSLPEYLHEETAKKIKDFYLNGKPVSLATFSQLTKAFTDRLYLNDVGKQAELHALFSGKPVYTGLYSYRGSYSFSDFLSNSTNNYGAAHLDDTLHIFKSFNLDSNSTGDLAMNKVLTEILVSFALNGVPQLPDGTEYPSLTPGSSVINRLEIISPTQFALTSSSLSNFGNRTFWNSFGFYENENA